LEGLPVVSVSKFLQTLGVGPNATWERERLAQTFVACGEALHLAPSEIDRIRAVMIPKAQGDLSLTPGKAGRSVYEISIEALLSGDQAPANTRAGSGALSCSVEYDALITDDDDWPIEKIINIALLRGILPTEDVAIVTSIRNEGLGLLEWVAHHLAQGVERIYIYANDNDDGSTPLIQALDEAGYIRFIENVNSHNVSPQRKAFEHSLNILSDLRRYRWAFYLDADEFFISRLEPALDLASLTRLPQLTDIGSSIDAVMFNWKWFGSENAFERSAGLLLDRFVHSKHESHVKSLVRLSNTLSMKHLHYPVMLYPDRAVRSDLTRPELGNLITAKSGPVYGLGQINHYWNKSFEEYLIKKFRGRGAVVGGDEQRDFRSFFEWGENGTRGAFDPPPTKVVSRTKALIEQMMQSPEIRRAMLDVEEGFKIKLAEFSSDIDIRALYKNRGML
jgi:hypothetical protein